VPNLCYRRSRSARSGLSEQGVSQKRAPCGGSVFTAGKPAVALAQICPLYGWRAFDEPVGNLAAVRPWMVEGCGYLGSCTCSGLGNAPRGHSLSTPACPWLWILSKLGGDPSSLCRYPSAAQSRKPGSEGKISSTIGIWGKVLAGEEGGGESSSTEGEFASSVSALSTGKSDFQKLKQRVFPTVVFSEQGTRKWISCGFKCLFLWAGTSVAARPGVRQGEVQGSQHETSMSFPKGTWSQMGKWFISWSETA